MINPNSEAKAVSYSRTKITELMLPSYSNFDGRINAGFLLSLMEKAAFTCATRHTSHFCVVASVDEAEFFEPVEVSDLVTLFASVNYVSNTSITVGVRVEAENIKTGVNKHVCTSYFTMIAKTADGRKVIAPLLLLEKEEDVRRFIEAMYRKDTKLRAKVDYKKFVSNLDINEHLNKLNKERCELAFDL